MKLENKVAIVTGASSGLGLAIANKLLSEGAKVVFSDINDMEINNENAFFIKCNVSKSEEVDSLVKQTVEKFERLDIFVNNAGIATMAPIVSMTNEEWQKVIDIDLTGVFYGTRAAAKYMKENDIKGSIINISSILGVNGFENAVSYCASKGGVNQITRTAAMELAPLIRVNAIAPGFIKTKMTEGALQDEGFNNLIKCSTPMGHVGEPEDIANAVLYLASEDAKYITGSILYVDGGWTAR